MKYKVIGNIKHDNKVLKIDSIVEFKDEEAKPLLEVGVIELAKGQEETKKEVETNDNDDKKGKDDDDNDDDKGDGLDGMKQGELKKIAEVEEVDITGLRKNQDIIDAIRSKRDDEAESL